jgi:proline racemase
MRLTDRVIRTVDFHTGGEPFRIVAEPPVDIEGDTVAARRVFAINDDAVDALRQLLCFEPRGHADMYGGFITPADDDGADFGVLFWHKDGFSTACGHGTIALGAWAVQSGRVASVASGTTDVVIDVPSGRVVARVTTEDARVVSVDFVNVASWLIVPSVTVATTRGPIDVALSFGGAIYAQFDVAQLDLAVTPKHLPELIAIGREVKWALDDDPLAQHPNDERLSGVYGTILYEHLGPSHQRNVTIFADGEVDRSPCGSGTCARLATLHATGGLETAADFVHDSIVGSRFVGRVLEAVDVDGRPAVLPQVTGTAYRTGEHVFHVDPDDPLVPGFVFR